MDGSTKFRLSPQALARKIGDDIVILDLAGGSYFGLDLVGARIWELMGEGKSISQICDTLIEEYDVSRDALERDAVALANDLIANNLAEPRQPESA